MGLEQFRNCLQKHLSLIVALQAFFADVMLICVFWPPSLVQYVISSCLLA